MYKSGLFVVSAMRADGTPNAMNAAWGGISEEKEITSVWTRITRLLKI